MLYNNYTRHLALSSDTQGRSPGAARAALILRDEEK